MSSPFLLPALALAITIAIFVRLGLARRRLEFRSRILELLALACQRGVPLTPLLAAAAREHSGARAEAAEAMHATLESGGSVAEAFEAAGTPWFGAYMATAARAAHGTDAMGPTLGALAAEDSRTLDGRHQVHLAMIYPALLILMALGVYSVVDLTLAHMGNWSFDFEAFAFVAKAGLWLAVAAVGIWILSQLMRRFRVFCPGSSLLHRARVLRLTSIFAGAGLSVPEALRRAGDACEHRGVAKAASEVALSIERGETSAAAWAPLRLPEAHSLRLGAARTSRIRETLADLAERMLVGHTRARERRLRWMMPASIALVAGAVLLEYAVLMQAIAHTQETVLLW